MDRYWLMARTVFWIHWLWIAALLVGFIIQWASLFYGAIETILLALTLAFLAWWKRCPLTMVEDVLLKKCNSGEAVRDSFIRRNLEQYFGIKIPRGAVSKTLLLMFIISAVLWLFRFFS